RARQRPEVPLSSSDKELTLDGLREDRLRFRSKPSMALTTSIGRVTVTRWSSPRGPPMSEARSYQARVPRRRGLPGRGPGLVLGRPPRQLGGRPPPYPVADPPALTSGRPGIRGGRVWPAR